MESPKNDNENFVTVVAVGPDSLTKCDDNSHQVQAEAEDANNSEYVTVLTIGDGVVGDTTSSSSSDNDNNNKSNINSNDNNSNNNTTTTPSKELTEEVLVYRLPGERLGFGLKFEGGTKANESVKRLFIQSCAPDSPASRVQSSWGKLSEGDEVLEIDCMPVNTMTRIDCVRCLKDSNVVIKLLVRHFTESCKQSRSLEDLPQVVSAEKKRTPPPPPPVPPRKIPKKFYKNNSAVNNAHYNKEATQSNENNNPVPAVRHNINSSEVTVSIKTKKLQSPRSSGRSSHSPDVPRRDRRFSDGSLGPPDAEVYVDLFSQESTQSLSESDDTGSSISTVVDRFGSFPTTTTSSLAGSLPSTPTSVQKHLDFSNLLNSYDDEEITNALNKNSLKLTISKPAEIGKTTDKSENVTVNGDEGVPLQPPSCFQDAPLSYGNENMRIIDAITNKNGEVKDKKVIKKPPVPPRSRDLINNMHNKNEPKENIHDENMNISNLPRLVDFVPKNANYSCDTIDSPAEIIQVFLENERRDTSNYSNGYGDNLDLDIYSNGDLYSSKWSLSSQLATIGEVEELQEESSPDSSTSRSTPIVVVENADSDTGNTGLATTGENRTIQDINGKMETLPSDSRQPPDGHEFPDYVETNNTSTESNRQNYTDTASATTKFSQQQELNNATVPDRTPLVKPSVKTYKTIECINLSQNSNRSSFNDIISSVPIQNTSNKSLLSKVNSVSNSDLSTIKNVVKNDPYDSSDEIQLRRNSLEPRTLHTRSQSLVDMSTISKQKNNDRWSLLAEQRKKGLSKLKGLVIPEHVSESETTPVPQTVVNIPEIISHTTVSTPSAAFRMEAKSNASLSGDRTRSHQQSESEPLALPLTSPPWTSTAGNNTLPKYSPAFKRKSLQVYPTAPPRNPQKLEEPPEQPPPPPIKSLPVVLIKNLARSKLDNTDEFRLLDNLSDSPKSLESITSPTRSDCSFDYVTNAFKAVTTTGNDSNSHGKKQESPVRSYSKESTISKSHKELGKSEDESDNDSAVSSSQSSYISRCSPPPSPTRSCEMHEYNTDSNNVRTIKTSAADDAASHLRLLKPASVEAINRKNILASAKCRSGRDLKVGSPVIQRKYQEENGAEGDSEPAVTQEIEEVPVAEQVDEDANEVVDEAVDEVEIDGMEEVEETEVEEEAVEPKSVMTTPPVSPPPVPENRPSPPIASTRTNVVVAKERRSISCDETLAKPAETKIKTETSEVIRKKTYIPTRSSPLTKDTTSYTTRPRTEISKTDYSKIGKTDYSKISTSSYLRSNAKSMSVTDLRKSFEKFGSAPPPLPHNVPVTVVKDLNKRDVKKVESKAVVDNKPAEKFTRKTEESAKIDTKPQSLKQTPSISPRRSSQTPMETGAIAPVANNNTSSANQNQRTVILCPEFFGGSIGITLAGGTDYETREITVHKIRYGSVAYNDGQLKKGDRIISINGKTTAGLTHAESVEMLKEAVSKFALVVEDGNKEEIVSSPQRKSFICDTPEPKSPSVPVPPKSVTNVVSLVKDGAGLGFSIEGGKDSPMGDLPLRVKKIFQGGAADKSGGLEVGDELLAINETTVINMSKIEVWTLMKKLPDGNVSIHIHR